MGFIRRRRSQQVTGWTPARLNPLLRDGFTNLKKRSSASVGALQFLLASSQRAGIVNAAKYQFGRTAAWTALFWVYNDATATGTDRRVFTKGVSGSDLLVRISTSNQVVATLGGGSGVATVTNSLVTIVATGWYLVLVEFDPVADTLTVTVGASNVGLQAASGSTAAVGAYTPGTTDLSFGATAGNTNFLTGRMSDCAKASRLLTADEKLALFAQGNGLSYTDAQAVTGLLTGFQWWFALNTLGGSLLVDRVGGVDTLTAVNAPAETGGVYTTAATQDGDLACWSQPSGSLTSVYSSALTVAQQPTLRIVGGKRYLEGAGASWLDDGNSTALALTGGQSHWGIYKGTTAASGDGLFGRWNGTSEGLGAVFSGADLLIKARSLTASTWTGGRTYLTDGNPHFWCLVRGASWYEFWVDGVRRCSGIVATLNSTAGIQSNWMARGNGVGPLHGQVAERGDADYALSDSQRVKLEAYAAKEYGVVVAAPRIVVDQLAFLGGSPTTAVSTQSAVGAKTAISSDLNPYMVRVSPTTIQRVVWETDTPTALPWYLQVWRQSSAGVYSLVQESEAFYAGGPGLQIFDLATPLAADVGDKLGWVVPTGATLGGFAASGSHLQTQDGHATGNAQSFTNFSTSIIPYHQMYGEGPNVVLIGDSNAVGRGPGSNAGAFWSFYESSGTGNAIDPTANILYACRQLDPRIRMAAYAQGGQQTAVALATQIPQAIAANPGIRAWVWLIGNNDIYQSSSNWAAMVTNYDAMYALIGNAVPIFILTLFPFTANTDPQSAEVRNVNAQFLTWKIGKPNVTIVDSWSVLGQLATTGFNDDYKTSPNVNPLADGLHIGRAGVDLVTPLLQPALSAALSP